VGRSLELEYSGADFATMHGLARQSVPFGSLSRATGRDLARSPRWDEVLRPVGIGDEAALACRDGLGCWGWIKAYRDTADHAFADEDLELLAAVGPGLGSALRRTRNAPAAEPTAPPAAPGVIVLDQALQPVSWTAGARSWVDAMPLAAVFAMWGMLPAVVYPAAALARASAQAPAHALERATDGHWIKIEAAPLEGEDDGKIAIVLRPATPAETFALLCRAYALTRREREVVAGLIAGHDTRALTGSLTISRHTVQDHLKSIFDKVNVRSRRQLLARFSASSLRVDSNR
jgi:DNA-binding CsgD family transcriptional regulator